MPNAVNVRSSLLKRKRIIKIKNSILKYDSRYLCYTGLSPSVSKQPGFIQHHMKDYRFGGIKNM